MKNDVYKAGNFKIEGLNFALAYSELNKLLKSNQPIDKFMTDLERFNGKLRTEVLEKAASANPNNEVLKPYLSQIKIAGNA